VNHSHEVHGNLSGKQVVNFIYRVLPSTIILHKRLKLTAYKIQLVQKLQHNDQARRFNYAVDILSRTRVDDLQVLRQRINDTVRSVSPQMLQNTWREIEYRLDVCRATRGAHVEIF
ncbi:hypothetical protein C0J52_10184, partial [Blattella germanica]